MGLPIPSGWNPAPIVVCAISALISGTAVFVRKCPGAIRFGAFAFSVFIFPFPFYWTHTTFMWGYWLWASLGFAGCAAYLFDRHIKHRNRTVRLLYFTILVFVLSFSSVWSAGITRHISAPAIEKHEIAMFAVSSEETGNSASKIDSLFMR